MMKPTTKHQLQTFIGLVNHYSYMWAIWSHLLQLLTVLTSDKVMFKWTAVEQKTFEDIKSIVAHNTLFSYPDFNEKFDIHTDASDYQIGDVIIQADKHISLYNRKLNGTQTKYTVTEKELFTIV